MNDDGYFDETVAATYDALHGEAATGDLSLMLERLDELATDRTALEFAVGTGRVALPLAKRGIEVAGIEYSWSMIQQLRKKDGGKGMTITIGDMASAAVNDQFSLVFLVYNTIDNLTTQAQQAACFRNAARHLKPGGRFLVETLVPPIQRLPFGETKLAFAADEDHWGIDVFDTVSQQYTSNHIRFEEGGETKRLSIPFRYAWPSEMDLMAQMAGMELESRWADWDKSPFTHTSKSHVSVWRKMD
ncbi:MAG: class I SAM-dependent methyltransferase [Alphaproteobacteria bacterium]